MRRVLRDRAFRTVIVTTKAATSWRGVLFSSDREALVVRNVEALTEGGRATPVDGELVLLMADVAFMQFV